MLEAEVLQSGGIGADEFHTYFPMDRVALHAKQALCPIADAVHDEVDPEIRSRR